MKRGFRSPRARPEDGLGEQGFTFGHRPGANGSWYPVTYAAIGSASCAWMAVGREAGVDRLAVPVFVSRTK